MSTGADDDEKPGHVRRKRLRSLLYSEYTNVLGILGACGLIYYLSTKIERVPDGLAQGIQPASFPQGVLVAILALLLLMIYELKDAPPRTCPEPVERIVYMVILAMFAALALATWVDFLLGMIAFVTVGVLMWGLRRPIVAISYAVALNATLFFLFSTLLQVRFPRGPLTSLLG
jgi:putative tricarboxylic transport membrane protein